MKMHDLDLWDLKVYSRILDPIEIVIRMTKENPYFSGSSRSVSWEYFEISILNSSK